MPWKEITLTNQRQAFVEQACQEGANISQICRTFGISRKTGYKWLKRYQVAGLSGLTEQSRRPHHSPQQTPADVEALLLRARQAHPQWGARKLKAWLEQRGLGDELPALSTITSILHRAGVIDPLEALKHRPYQRFEREQPNQLWQMDFKGDVVLQDGQVCYPLTVLDDHSRFLLMLPACADMTRMTVQSHLTATFRCYGLPEYMLMDNGIPWNNRDGQPHTGFTVWLMRLGIRVLHGRPAHPQTQGKVERLHRSLEEELLAGHFFPDRMTCHVQLATWREQYNTQRPHQALADRPPATCYQPSAIPFPDPLPPVEYDPHLTLRKVQRDGCISFQGRKCRIGTPFQGHSVAIQPDPLEDGRFEVYFLKSRVAILDFNRYHYPLS